MQLAFHEVTFTYENAIDPLFRGISAHFPAGWTGIIGANGAGKTTLLRLACGDLSPEEGSIYRPGRVIYCEQRTDFAPEGFEHFISSSDADACRIRGRLSVGDDWPERWNTLSHGERKRAQIGTALWRMPDILAIDEPTNHIDASARLLLIHALKSFQGIGLLVSHDREMLDSLCRQCLIIDPPNVTMRQGGYTQAVAQGQQEEASIRKEYRNVKKEAVHLAQEAARRRREASRADVTRSKRKISPGDHDAKGKIDLARVTGKDGKAGRLASQMDGRLQQTQEKLAEFSIKRQYDLNFWLPGSRSHRDTLFTIPEGCISLGDERRLCFPELVMLPDERIAVTGTNGGGKSTLIGHIHQRLSLPHSKVIYMPQEIDMEMSRHIMAEVNSLSRAQLGQVMTIVSCLGSRPERLIGGTEASPGEIRKVMLALGVTRAPHLIIMDEPTNHLDLPAIECLEQALIKCPCALLLVSHDYHFLSRLTSKRWHLESSEMSSDVRLSLRDTSDEW